jgi:tetratricopeptide (TPR) repeat protein
MHNLATLYNNRGLYEQAEPLLLETIEEHRRVLGDDHPNTLGSMNNLAFLFSVQGRYSEAEPLFLETLEIEQRALGNDHPVTLSSTNLLGRLYVNTGRLAQAGTLLHEVLDRRLRVFGEDHRDVGDSYYGLGCLAAAGANDDESIFYLRRAVELGWSRASILSEPSLEELRGRPDFESIVAEVKESL